MRTHLITEGGTEQSHIVVGRALMSDVVAAYASTKNVVVLCQPSTEDLASRYSTAFEAAGVHVVGTTLPDGEAAKSLRVVEDVYRLLNGGRITRGDAVIAIGGGALTDVAGFIAATYVRGIAAAYVPTTLLGAVDAAIGGKTAVNVDGKNLAGVFKHPENVFVDIDTIDQLPRRQQVIGAAEALKTGFIADMAIVDAYENDSESPDLEDIVNRSIAVKVAVVNDDFTEQGHRAILNYGHTVGHAIETATGMSHGEAVSIGMVAAGAASRAELGFDGMERQRSVLAEVGLPVAVADTVRADQVRALMALDKKRDHDGIRMVLLQAFGAPVVVPAGDATVAAAFEGVGLTS
jgi:3-dehydroquinate synthase